MAYSHDINLTSPGAAHNINFGESLIFNISPTSPMQVITSDNIELVQHHILSITDTTQGQTSDNTILVYHLVTHSIISNAAMIIEIEKDSNAYISNAAIQIEISPIDNVFISDAAVMVEYYVPWVKDCIQGQTSDNIVLIYSEEEGSITLQNSVQEQTSDNVILTQSYILIVQDTTQLQTADNIILIQHQILSIQDAIHNQTSDDVTPTQQQILSIQDAMHGQASDNIILIQHQILPIQDTTHSQTSENIILTQQQILSVQGAIHNQISENIILVQHQILSIQDTTHSQTSENITLTQHQILSIRDAIHNQTSDDVTQIQHHILSIQDAIHGQASDNIILIQHQILSIQDTTHSQTSENITLTQHQILSIQNLAHGQTSDNIELLQHQTGSVTILNSVQSQTSDNIILTQHHILTIQNINQLQLCDNIILIQNYILIIDNITHEHTSYEIILIHNQILSIDNITQLQNIDNIILTVHIPVWSLIVQNTIQLQASDNIQLIENYLLIIENIVHSIGSDNIQSIQNYILMIRDAIQLQYCDSILLNQNYTLIIDNTLHIHATENTVLIHNYILVIQNIIHNQTTENIILVENYILFIQETIHLQTADNIFYAGITENAIHLQISDDVILTPYIPTWVLTVENTIQSQTSGDIELTQNYILIIQNSIHLHVVDTILFAGIPSNAIHLQTSDKIILTTHAPTFSLTIETTTQQQTVNNITLFLPTGNILSDVGSFILASGDRVIYTGFRPKVILFWWSGGLGSGNITSGSNIAYGFGAGTSASSLYLTEASADELTTSNTYRGWAKSDGVIRITNPTGTALSQLTIKSMNSDGFTLSTTTFTKNYRISYLALGGNGLTSAKIGYAQMPSAIGEYDVTGIGFQPDALLTLHGFTNNTSVYQAGEYFNMGMATSASCQGTISIAGLSAQATSSTARYGYNGEVNSTVYPPNLIYYRESFVSFLPDGFRMNHLEGNNLKYAYIVLKGGRYIVGDIITETNNNDMIETTSFQPSVILFTSVNQELIGGDTGSAHGKWSIGAGNQSEQAVHAISDKNNVDITETAHGNYDNAVYAFIENDEIVGKMEIKSIDFTGFVTTMNIPDPYHNWITYLAIGGVGETNRAVQTQASENIILTAYDYNLLTIQDTIHIQTIDNTILVTDIVILKIQDCTQTQVSVNVGLVSSLSVLTLQNYIHLQGSENVILSAHYILTIQNTIQAQTPENVFLIWSVGGKISSKVGSFNIDPSKTVGQTQVITSLGFRPKVVIFWCSGGTASGDYVARGTFNVVFGAATSGTERFCVGSISEDNQATSDNFHWSYNSQIIRIYNNTGSINGILDFTSMDDDGFTTHIDDQFTAAFKIDYLALGGNGLTNVKIGSGPFNTSSGETHYTGTGFKPDALIFASSLGSQSSTGANSFIILGMATDSSHQGVTAIRGVDNQGTSSAQSYGYNGESITSVQSLGNTYYRQNLVSMDNDGFTLNMTEPFSAWYFFYIALKGGNYTVGELNTRTDENDIIETTGFKPSSLLMFSNNRPLSIIDQSTSHGSISIGAVDYMGNQAAASIWEEDGTDPSQNAYGNYNSAIYLNITDSATLGAMRINSLDDDGFTANMTIPDPSENWVTYLAIGIPPTLLIVQNSSHLQTGESLVVLYYLNPARGDNVIHIQTCDNIDLAQNYVIVVSDAVQIQETGNTHITTNIVILRMNDSIQTQISQEISFRAVNIFGYRKISFAIGKKGTGKL